METLFRDTYIAIDKSYGTDPRGLMSALKNGGKFETLISLLSEYSIEKENRDVMLAEWEPMNASYVENNIYEFNFINPHKHKEDLLLRCKCLCGTCLNYLFPIKNKYANHNYIAFIGSSCINHFGEEMVSEITNKVKKILNLYNCEVCKGLIRKRFDWHDKVRKHKKCLTESEYKSVFLIEKYPDVCVKKTSVKEYVNYDSEPDDLDLNDSYINIQAPKVPTFSFGKCKGVRADVVLKNDIGYCKWFARTIDPEDTKTKILCEYLKKNIN